MINNLKKWLTESCQLLGYDLQPLTGDASFRRYFRVNQKTQSYVAMDASAEKQSCLPFVAISNALRAQRVKTPEVFAQDFSQGFLLLTDFGNQLYLNELNSTNAATLYHQALDTLHLIQQCKTIHDWNIQPFTVEFMVNELNLFKEWFLEKHLSLTLTEKTQQMLATCFNFLAESAAAQPQTFMHRDYHSANLMVLPNNQVGVLDFQDAFLGPITYDLVSLLRDCYIVWPENKINEWVLYFWEKIALPNVSLAEFSRWFDLMGIQRHLKALLTFSRKYRRDHNSNYLQHIPRTLNYIMTVSARYPECQELNLFLKETVVEKCVE